MEFTDTSSGDPSPDEWLIAIKNFNVTRLIDTEFAVSAEVCPQTSLNLSIIRMLKRRPEVLYPVASFGQYTTVTKKHGRSTVILELTPFAWITSNKRLIVREKDFYTYFDPANANMHLNPRQLIRLHLSLSKNVIELIALYEMDAKTTQKESGHLLA